MSESEPVEKLKLWVPKPSSFDGLVSWIGIDLDGTLAQYTHFLGHDHIGEPVPEMLDFVKRLIAQGQTVKIFTARATDPESIPVIKAWAARHGLGDIEVTCVKDYGMTVIYDDRAIGIITNTGKRSDGQPLNEFRGRPFHE